MAKLIFESVDILQGETTTSAGKISNITVEGVEISLEPDTVNVEDNREIYESYTGRIMIRSKNVNFDDTNPVEAILDSPYVSTDGTLPTEGRIRLNGKSGSHVVTSELGYIQGHQSFDNGRLETVLMIQASAIDGTNAIEVSDA
jgi:hypothetical protein